MEFEILVSTMDKNEELIKKMNIKSPCLIINQCKENQEIKNQQYRIIKTKTKGLSISRNLALNNAKGKICLLADDDLIYKNDLEKIILDSFNKDKGYDLIAFQVEGIDRVFKNYKNKEKKIGYLHSMKISSVEIAFRLDSIRAKNIEFDELLGSGAEFSMGEENAFLFKCLKAGLKIKYIPIKIADLYVGNSSWFNGYNEKYFISRGAAFTAMSRRTTNLLILQFAIRKYNLYCKNINFINTLRYMNSGKKKYLKECRK
ncbi:MAG: glycosyltransferase [Sarcina sp.]